ncbi:hypothetical protein [Nocardia coffeae]|uniref:hypothetical protein n=1 Tax=Nocardia coffeae TaxID=2873381 RepID=UPI001F185C8C|nr:hypothetical protein [Nocardia coffeae]
MMNTPAQEHISAVEKIIGRAELAAASSPATATGWIHCSPTADITVPMSASDRGTAAKLTRDTLVAAGVRSGDRVVVALNNDGEPAGALIAGAAADVAAAVVNTGARGRMRLVKVIETVRANVLVITPTGAADLLARLHMEFLADPLDLELRLLVLTGEIADAKTARHLATEFGADVVNVFTDPVTSVPVAHHSNGSLVPTAPTQLTLVQLDSEKPLDPADTATLGEVVVRHEWHEKLSGLAVRTGYLARYGEDGGIQAPEHTAGDHILVRGRWLSIPNLTAALRRIDGITQWRLEVSRRGTLDAATLTVSFNRDSLVGNPMWRGRVEQALSALTPVSIAVAVDPTVREEPAAPVIADHRGHHLGERATVTTNSAQSHAG